MLGEVLVELSCSHPRDNCINRRDELIFAVGGSLRDVQMLAGHRALSTTQRYIEADVEAQKRVVDLV